METEHAHTVDLLLRVYRAMGRRRSDDNETLADLRPVIESHLADLFGHDWKSDWLADKPNSESEQVS